MVTLIAPNGATIEACEEHVKRLLDMGFRKQEPEKKPKATRRRAAKPKE